MLVTVGHCWSVKRGRVYLGLAFLSKAKGERNSDSYFHRFPHLHVSLKSQNEKPVTEMVHTGARENETYRKHVRAFPVKECIQFVDRRPYDHHAAGFHELCVGRTIKRIVMRSSRNKSSESVLRNGGRVCDRNLQLLPGLRKAR